MVDAPEDESVKKMPIAKQFGKVSLDPGKPTINIGRNIPPSGSDLILFSCDWRFNIGPLQRSILRRLGANASQKQVFYSDEFTEISRVGDFVLGGIVSIPKMTSGGANGTARDSAEAVERNLFRMLTSRIDGHLFHTDINLWLPLLGTGSAGLSYLESARIIRKVLDQLDSEGTDSIGAAPRTRFRRIRQINIALPSGITDEDETAILEMFDITTAAELPDQFHADPAVDDDAPPSEMPDHFHSDRPVEDISGDDLNRDAIAKTIATNVIRVWPDQIKHSRPFAVHLSGRWGSGKSTILNFLEAHLKADTDHSSEQTGTTSPATPKGWVVVKYNAWQMQDAGPPWWTLRNAVASQGYKALGPRGTWLRATDWCWRRSQMLRPWLWVALVISLLAAVSFFFNPFSAAEKPSGPWSFLAGVASSVAALGALLGLLSNFTKSASEKAEALRELHSDPTAHLQNRFAKMISDITRPTAVFIDDLDRCDAKFVVDLLQSLQTAYADVPVLYVVASDRDWIVSAYNQVYKDFQTEVAKPGLPLGYLFVKKIFQLSVAVPDLAENDTEKMTRALLETKDRAASQADVDKAEAEFDTRIKNAVQDGDMAALSQIGSEATTTPAAKLVAAKLMEAVGSDEIQKKVRHALIAQVKYMDGNPRFLKRLINAITFRQGYILMAGEQIEFDIIARWTILCLRFPYSADAIAADPSLIDAKRGKDTTTKFFHDPAIDDILTGITQTDIAKIRRFG